MTEFPASIFKDSHPAQLQCGDWKTDQSFLQASRSSWQAQYAEYMGDDEAVAYLRQLEQEQRLFSHYDPLTVHARIEDRIVGVGALRPLGDINLVTLLEVHPDFHGRGIGRQLLQALCTAGPHTMAHVSIHRPGVRAFYLKHGFHLLERTSVTHGLHILPFDVLAR